ncbi:pentatricopeptide repeat-containing protein [Striga asiatica]|uniref:Pentatricopeptide repeat-containing protein n=1 Tax=Striga asiatica TaxID=4170 RepID=A0A5A7QQ18_STRAF|nr:pentatricopeptide repeat-containing protein [Striga asiatica]
MTDPLDVILAHRLASWSGLKMNPDPSKWHSIFPLPYPFQSARKEPSRVCTMKLLRLLTGNHRAVVRSLGRRNYSAPSEEYLKRNYANNDAEYNTVIGSLTSQRRYYLLRDVYDDMMLDGVQPLRDTFHSLVVGTMKGSRMQDAFFFRDEMKTMGLVPDVALYNYLISTCGKCRHSSQAIQLLDEMKKCEVKPTGQTYICLLHACAATGRLDRVYAIVRDMTAAGLGLNKFCYAGLIIAHKNKATSSDDTTSKIIELVEQSKGWSAVDHTKVNAENVMKGISEEELYNLPTAEYMHRRGGFIFRPLTVYHTAFWACADLKDVQATDKLLEMFEKDEETRDRDVYILMQVMRCYLHAGDIDRGLKIFEDYMSSNRPPMVELYVTLIEGAMVGYTPRGMQIAQDTLVNMNAKGLFLSFKMANDLLLVAAGEEDGGYFVANFLWDLMQTRKMTPSLPAVQAYHNGLRGREVPEDDPRLQLVSSTLNNLKLKENNTLSSRRIKCFQEKKNNTTTKTQTQEKKNNTTTKTQTKRLHPKTAADSGPSLTTVVEEVGDRELNARNHSKGKKQWRELELDKGLWRDKWCIGGDWNALRGSSDKRGGRIRPERSFDSFNAFSANMGMMEVHMEGYPYTWVIIGAKVTSQFRSAFDHSMLILDTSSQDSKFFKRFVFDKRWLKRDRCAEEVEKAWSEEVAGNPIVQVREKVKRIRMTIIRWNKVLKSENVQKIEP